MIVSHNIHEIFCKLAIFYILANGINVALLNTNSRKKTYIYKVDRFIKHKIIEKEKVGNKDNDITAKTFFFKVAI